MTNEAEERARFEKWSVEHLGDDRYLLRDEQHPDSYDAYLMDHLWLCWQAARAASPVSAPIEDAFWKHEALTLVVLLKAKCSDTEWAGMEEKFQAAKVASVSSQRSKELRTKEREYIRNKLAREQVEYQTGAQIGGVSLRNEPLAAPVSAEQPTLEKFVLELAEIYGLDESFMRALPVPTLKMWQMLVREEAKRHKSERKTMEKFRAELIALKFPAAAPSVASEDSATQPSKSPDYEVCTNQNGHPKWCKCGSEDWMRKAAEDLAAELRRRCNTKMSLLHQSAWYEAANELEKFAETIIAKHYAASHLSTEKKI